MSEVRSLTSHVSIQIILLLICLLFALLYFTFELLRHCANNTNILSSNDYDSIIIINVVKETLNFFHCLKNRFFTVFLALTQKKKIWKMSSSSQTQRHRWLLRKDCFEMNKFPLYSFVTAIFQFLQKSS
jgi:hypothetical protein